MPRGLAAVCGGKLYRTVCCRLAISGSRMVGVCLPSPEMERVALSGRSPGVSLQSKKIHVFISYARADASRFVSELATCLEIGGFQPLVDQQSISPAEDWKQRIGVLIQQCDSLIAVITPSAVKSEIFNWEVEEAIRLSKRIVPVEWLPTPIADVPRQLNRLNFVFFSADRSFAQGLKMLAEALESDLEWVREHTR